MHVNIEDLLAGLVLPYTPQNTQVYLNGEYVQYCIEANEEEGYVICYEKVDGRFKVDGEHLTTIRLEGDVQIKLEEPILDKTQ